jgi:hypothetical protein
MDGTLTMAFPLYGRLLSFVVRSAETTTTGEWRMLLFRIIALICVLYFLYLGWSWSGDNYQNRIASCSTIELPNHVVIPASEWEYLVCMGK